MGCEKCGNDKPEEAFAWRFKDQGIRLKVCKECHNTLYGRVWYQKNKESHKRIVYKNRKLHRHTMRIFITEYLKQHPCNKCGFKDFAALEFHYKGNKLMEISRMITTGWGLEGVKKEISKCEVLCANCHRIQTAKDQGWYVSST